MPLYTHETFKPIPGTPIDRSSMLAQGLALCFPFNEGSGPAIEVLQDRPVTRVSPATTAWGSSQYGPTYGSDGTEYATIASPQINSQPAVSVALLWKCASGQPGDGRIIEKGANNEWGLFHNSSTNKVSWWFALGFTDVVSVATIFDNTFHHLVGTFDGTTGSLYVDGVSQGSNTHTSAASTTNALNLFRYGGGGFQTASKLAGLWIWNRGLSKSEVLNHYRNPWRMFQAPQPYWLYKPAAAASVNLAINPFPSIPGSLLAI